MRYPCLLLTILCCTLGCVKKEHTDASFFDCHLKAPKVRTDKQELIYLVLERGLVTDKAVTDYRLIRKKKKMYVQKEVFGSEGIAIANSEVNGPADVSPLSEQDVPHRIGEVEFCLKSQDELQKIVERTNPFVSISLGHFILQDSIALIAIATGWQSTKMSKVIYMSGGGGIWQYRKAKGKWQFEKETMTWIH